MQQTFSVGPEPRISLGRISGDLKVRGWERQEISVNWGEEEGAVHQEGDVLILANYQSDVELQVPYDTEILVEETLAGTVEAENVQRVELKNVRGDVELVNIGGYASLEKSGEAVLIVEMDGELSVKKASSVRTRRKVGGDAQLEEVPLVEMEMVGGDLELRTVGMAVVGLVGGNLSVVELSQGLRCGSVGSEGEIHANAQAEINLGNVGSDLEINSAALVHLGNIGGDSSIREVGGNVRVGNIGGDASISGVGGELSVGRVGGDAELHGLAGSIRMGGIGGDLELDAAFPPESRTHLQVGGDAEITLPASANLVVQATVGGSVSGPSIAFKGKGNLVRLVYSEGAAQINLSVGGDLELRGGGAPQINSANIPWEDFEMGAFGWQMSELGQELGHGFAEMFNDASWASASWAWDFTHKMEDQMRKNARKTEHHMHKARERARQAEERARRASERASRIYVRVNEREWEMNPERLNDLVARAQQAALDGVTGAIEAVERAIGNLRPSRPPHPPRSPRPPRPGQPPTPPTGPRRPPVPPVPPVPPAPPNRFANFSERPDSPLSEPQDLEQPEGHNLEQEREAILRMIVEGRITPEEGDMLLEGLGG